MLLLRPEDFIDTQLVRIAGRRYEHLRSVLQVQTGDIIRAGLLDGAVGTATVQHMDQQTIALTVVLQDQPPAAIPVEIVMALPRPKVLKRVLQSLASLGVKHIYLVQCQKVEKSYWQSPILADAEIQEQLILGLEQSKDTVLPSVGFYRRFKPFVQDVLPDLLQGRSLWIAHPDAAAACMMQQVVAPVTYAIGPEGGFTDYEVQLLQAAGGRCCHLGRRVLRVETVIPVLLARWQV